MDLSPDALRSAQFTERFRGYDAAEVDTFLNEAADALEGFFAEQSAPMAALAAEQARLAIEEVRRDRAAVIEELDRRQGELTTAVDDLRRMLEQRRRGAIEELELIDAALAETLDSADTGTDGGTGGDDAAESDTFLARLEQVASEEDDPGAG
jgi:DivIVA domain-containing protein